MARKISHLSPRGKMSKALNTNTWQLYTTILLFENSCTNWDAGRTPGIRWDKLINYRLHFKLMQVHQQQEYLSPLSIFLWLGRAKTKHPNHASLVLLTQKFRQELVEEARFTSAFLLRGVLAPKMSEVQAVISRPYRLILANNKKDDIRKQLSQISCFTVSSHWNDRNILNTCHPETFSDIQWPTLQDSKPNTIPHPLTRPRCGKKVSHPQKTVALLLQDVRIFTEGHQLKLFFFCGGAMV